MKKAYVKVLTEAVGKLEEAKGLIEPIASEMREAFDNKSEKAQENDAGQKQDAEATSLEEAVGAIEEALEELLEIDC